MLQLGKFVLALSLALCANAEAATKAIKFGKLWDGHTTIANAVVIRTACSCAERADNKARIGTHNTNLLPKR